MYYNSQRKVKLKERRKKMKKNEKKHTCATHFVRNRSEKAWMMLAFRFPLGSMSPIRIGNACKQRTNNNNNDKGDFYSTHLPHKELVSRCSEPSQPHRVISKLIHTKWERWVLCNNTNTTHPQMQDICRTGR